MSSDVMISAHGIGKAYALNASPLRQMLAQFRPSRQIHDFWALRPLDLTVRRGEVIGVIGQNGSGKSTLLQLLCNTLSPSCGTVQVNGRLAALLELGAGFNLDFTGWENIRLSAALYGLSLAETEQKIEAIAAFADIGDFIDKPVKTYSSGMFVRLAFAVIANIDADILVIDEALAVGDVFFTQKCMRFLQSFAEKGTILFVSHDSASVVSLCNRAILLEHGTLLADGDPKTITEYYLQKQYSHQQPQTDQTPVKTGDSAVNHGEFGLKGLSVQAVSVLDSGRQPVFQLHGATSLCLNIQITAHQDTAHPLVGFSLKDRLGQVMFGGNSADAQGHLPALQAGQSLQVEFDLTVPGLTLGDYMISVAVGEGNARNHLMHHWIHDAYALRSTLAVQSGMLEIPVDRMRHHLLSTL
ncbi:ABC transporter ATP-binding protein [Undibacterium griseum]|uniref:ABC transporter ATP-binding protein n=1 Tax=Undibacterium griseum TaxID=2762295 RepID=A0ABR6YPH9_9BURK|nr:ABC transporter ATP-binding protein [Undibacterium griseum]MBC3885806.1 ABC transporter ATP-binding protein [Undibacterium griseum]